MGKAASKPIPQPTINAFDADVPIIPPLVILALLAVSFVLAKTFTRYRWLPDELASLGVRLALFASMMAISVKMSMSAADELHGANSGVGFTPVGGIAKSGLYAYSRNPLYVMAVFVQLPMFGMLFDCAWIIYSAFALFVYLSVWVIPGEEAFLLRNYGEAYETYLNSTPRWLLPDSD